MPGASARSLLKTVQWTVFRNNCCYDAACTTFGFEAAMDAEEGPEGTQIFFMTQAKAPAVRRSGSRK